MDKVVRRFSGFEWDGIVIRPGRKSVPYCGWPSVFMRYLPSFFATLTRSRERTLPAFSFNDRICADSFFSFFSVIVPYIVLQIKCCLAPTFGGKLYSGCPAHNRTIPQTTAHCHRAGGSRARPPQQHAIRTLPTPVRKPPSRAAMSPSFRTPASRRIHRKLPLVAIFPCIFQTTPLPALNLAIAKQEAKNILNL